MPHSSDSKLIGNLFRAQVAEQEERRRAELESRLQTLKSQLNDAPDNTQTYLDLANCYRGLGEHLKAVDTLQEGAYRLPLDGEIHYALIRLLQKCGLDEEALAAGKRGCSLLPDDFVLRLQYELYLPKLYDSEPEIHAYHRRYEEGLEKCIAACDLETREGALRAARGFSRYANFYLAYQGFDDLPLIRRYGEFVHRVMSAAYPQWAKLSRERPAREKPVVAYVSAYFRDHTVGKLFLGWLTQRDRNLYRAHSYYAGESADSMTEAYRSASDSFFQSCDLEAICQAIEDDRPDILVFTDVGMNSLTSQIAALRLAPVQCVTWGHPVTTGLPTIDYFISSELMEPPDAQEHYSEELVTLPSLGIHYSKPVIPRPFLTKTRADYGLPDDAVVYLSCQSQFKYLPQYDHLVAKIAVAVPNAHFVFLAPNQLRSRKFLTRLERAFSAVGLLAAHLCTILPEQDSFDYWNLHLVSDVFLDSVGWSGGMTTLEALAAGLPIVTLEGQLMRSRHTAAILMRFGIPETVGQNETEYVTAAIRLGSQLPLRKDLRLRMESAQQPLFSDYAVVRALESFILQALEP